MANTGGAYYAQQEAEKQARIQAAMQKMATNPNLTASEKSQLSSGIEAKGRVIQGADQAIETYNTRATAQPVVQNNAALIEQQMRQVKEAKLASIRAAAAKATRAQQGIIDNAPQTYQPLRNNVDTNRALSIQRVKEQMANIGGFNGGDNITAQVGVNTAAGNDMNAIDMDQARTIQAAKNAQLDIADNLAASEADVISETDLARIQALIDENNRVDTTNYNRLQDSIANKRYADDVTRDTEATAKRDYVSTVDRFSSNYQAEINKVQNDGDTSNDWQIPILQSAREQKIKEIAEIDRAQKAAEAKALADQQAAQQKAAQQAFENDLKMQQLELDKQKTKYDTSKPYYAPKSSSSNTPSVSQQNADAKKASQQLTGDVMTYLDQWASGKAEDKNGQRADQTDMINYIKANSGVLTSQGVDVDAILQWIKNNYEWIR